MNNPIMYADPSGHWIETVFDILSLSASIVEVVINPANPWAWAGLVGDGWDLVQGLNKISDGFTVSNKFIGTDIHTKFKYGSRVIDIHNRVDGIDDALRLVYELKPYNKRSIRQGIKQLYRYQKAIYKKIGVMYDMILVVY